MSQKIEESESRGKGKGGWDLAQGGLVFMEGKWEAQKGVLAATFDTW